LWIDKYLLAVVGHRDAWLWLNGVRQGNDSDLAAVHSVLIGGDSVDRGEETQEARADPGRQDDIAHRHEAQGIKPGPAFVPVARVGTCTGLDRLQQARRAWVDGLEPLGGWVVPGRPGRGEHGPLLLSDWGVVEGDEPVALDRGLRRVNQLTKLEVSVLQD